MRILETLEEIDAVLRSYPWLDMSIVSDDGRNVVIEGSLLESYPFEIRLVLHDVQCVCARRDWHTDTSRQVLCEVVDPRFNQAYRIETGFRIFELTAEDVSSTMRFVARRIHIEVHREPSP
ncbi:MAG: hypothetical protein V4710_08055 [Verrucomicrobiota bacterium]